MNYLVNNYSIDKLQISKPKKHSEEYLICKIKYPESPDDFFIQFPKMKLVQLSPKSIELEFLPKETKYTKECYNFLSELDSYISEYICTKSEEWFDKKIPMENIKNMYNNFIKAPKSTENQSTINFTLKKDTTFINRRNNEIDLPDVSPDSEIECISQLKYILFSKDNCFTIWELHSAKVHKKIDKVPANGFIAVEESDSDSEVFNFF
jgi:hypothetical protein